MNQPKHYQLLLHQHHHYLIFRWEQEEQEGLPVTRFLRWHRSPAKRVVSLEFDPSGRWLLVCSADSSLVLLPVYYLMRRAGLHNAPYPVRDAARTLARAQATDQGGTAGSPSSPRADDGGSSSSTAPKAESAFSFMSSLFAKAQQTIRFPIGSQLSQQQLEQQQLEEKKAGNPFDCVDDASIITAAVRVKYNFDEGGGGSGGSGGSGGAPPQAAPGSAAFEPAPSGAGGGGGDDDDGAAAGPPDSGSRGVGRLVGRKPGGPGGTVSTPKKTTVSASLGRRRAMGAVWWQTRCGGMAGRQQDLAVIVNAKGNVTFVDMVERRICGRNRLRLHAPIASVQLVQHVGSASYHYCFLLVFTVDHGCYRVLLEQNSSATGPISVLTAPPHSPQFEPVAMHQETAPNCRTFSPLSRAGLRAAAASLDDPAAAMFTSATLLPVFGLDASRLELFDADPQRPLNYPQFTHQLQRGAAVRLVSVPSPHWLACVIGGYGGSGGRMESLVLFSRGVSESGGGGGGGELVSRRPDVSDAPVSAVLGVFQLPRGEKILALEPRWHRMADTNAGRMASLLCITAYGVYECQLRSAPDSLFQEAVAAGRDSEAAVIGRTWQLDVLALFAKAAQAAEERGELTRALTLWKSAGASGVALAARLAQYGELTEAARCIRRTLADPAKLSPQARRETQLVAALFHCIDQLHEEPQDAGAVEDGVAGPLCDAVVGFSQQPRGAGQHVWVALMDELLAMGAPLSLLVVPAASAVLEAATTDDQRVDAALAVVELVARHGAAVLGGPARCHESLCGAHPALWAAACVCDQLLDQLPLFGQLQALMECSVATLARRFARLRDLVHGGALVGAAAQGTMDWSSFDALIDRLAGVDFNRLRAADEFESRAPDHHRAQHRPVLVDEFFELQMVCRLQRGLRDADAGGRSVRVSRAADLEVDRLLRDSPDKFRGATMVQWCMEYGAWTSAANLWAQKLSSPMRAFDCRCALAVAAGPGDSSVCERVLRVLSDSLEGLQRDVDGQRSVLMSLFALWNRHELPWADLEAHFARHMDVFAGHLLWILNAKAAGQLPTDVQLSPGFEVATLRWQSPDAAAVQESIADLQLQIGALIRQRRRDSRKTGESLLFVDRRQMPHDVVFTCSHSYSRDAFDLTVLPEFSRVHAHQPKAFLQFALAAYQKQREANAPTAPVVTLPCPKCLTLLYPPPK